jgi:hypothetical protein
MLSNSLYRCEILFFQESKDIRSTKMAIYLLSSFFLRFWHFEFLDTSCQVLLCIDCIDMKLSTHKDEKFDLLTDVERDCCERIVGLEERVRMRTQRMWK